VSTIDLRGHTAATLYEAAVIVGGRGPYSLDPLVRAAWPGATVVGPAFTVQGAGGDNLVLHRAVLAAPEGAVLVVDVNGAPFGHWGEVLAIAAEARGISGLVIDGGVRDTVEMGELGFPVFARHTCLRGTRKLFRGSLQVDIEVGGVAVRNGDIVVGDADGVVVLPAGIAADVVDEADERVRKEGEIIRRLRAGETTLDLYGLSEAGPGRALT
jgi:4-hydroxy-4-methyl-2-oxoglutarate aldolase